MSFFSRRKHNQQQHQAPPAQATPVTVAQTPSQALAQLSAAKAAGGSPTNTADIASSSTGSVTNSGQGLDGSVFLSS